MIKLCAGVSYSITKNYMKERAEYFSVYKRNSKNIGETNTSTGHIPLSSVFRISWVKMFKASIQLGMEASNKKFDSGLAIL